MSRLGKVKGKQAGRFPKGVSGNPGGRPKVTEEVRAVREALRSSALTELWLKQVESGMTLGDIKFLELWAKHALGDIAKLELEGRLETSPASPLTTAQLLSIAK